MKKLATLLMVLCYSLITTITVFANSTTILEKQKEVDHYIFEVKKDELAKKGITVTHTVPLENQVEIGITPYNRENANYFYKAFGKVDVKVVEGEQAVTMTENSTQKTSIIADETPKKDSPNYTAIYLTGAVIVGAGILLVMKMKKAIK
ncbi:hypothetical protein [Neobacillus sp. PS3-40]|uniref:hypothetical protein n=1 Tax=Neobacillus sp. PS3-40 TaxID=3070679 RepID=UPI0027E1382A|nr:hypothetical protein [Neobacillus sp. PS3-40]WML44191.1 hypothetical protein RCG20_20830 [Neobacillus sp. PS3-40]